MKYTKEITAKILDLYATKKLGPNVIAQVLGAELGEIIPERSIIAKLSTLGVYQKKQYLTKRGEIPVRKSEYIEKIAIKLNTDVETLESLEKVTKNVLILVLDNLAPKDGVPSSDRNLTTPPDQSNSLRELRSLSE